jgi:hypothetical protein
MQSRSNEQDGPERPNRTRRFGWQGSVRERNDDPEAGIGRRERKECEHGT